MNVKIITIHFMHNPGSVFQAYALQQYLNLNYTTQIIDYRPEYLYSENNKWKLWIKKILYGREYRSRSKKFENFVTQNLVLTPRYNSIKELKAADMKADVFMTGSDQLWNTDFPCGNDPAYYLEFVDVGSKKVSYSTSVGKKTIDEHNLVVLSEKLKGFSSVAVREKSTTEILQKELNRTVHWVCDPVFLLQAKDYQKFINEQSVLSDAYVMVYMSGASPLLSEIVDYFHNAGKKVVLAGGFTKRCYCDLHIKDVGPEDFLSLISRAEIVISSSFHATAFCHILHKEFITLIPERNGERILNLLAVTGLENRGVYDTFSSDKVCTAIDWLDVDKRLSEYIELSKEYLKTSLNW